ncbi:inositol-tetrakisphosphate 1-kinase 1-like [Hibiscus syriacus]|uniref:non-specific serine/threonine protein kinase n=1 Tax=Hibiscus syriacus TaxID=106335 RepID=A0A6A3AC87_HIBSY|nr:inositol-tetrakisphosphate 1-kinase 1-like [Hibiscus syriacus]
MSTIMATKATWLSHFNIKPSTLRSGSTSNLSPNPRVRMQTRIHRLIDGLCKMGELVVARSYFVCILKYGVLPNIFAYNCLVDGSCRADNWNSNLFSRKQSPFLCTKYPSNLCKIPTFSSSSSPHLNLTKNILNTRNPQQALQLFNSNANVLNPLKNLEPYSAMYHVLTGAGFYADARLGVLTPVLYAVDHVLHTLTYEYVEGPSIKDVFLGFGSNGVVQERLADIATQISDAIGKLHDSGFVHDGRPDNLSVDPLARMAP